MVSGKLHAQAALPTGEISAGTRWIRSGWAGLDAMEQRKISYPCRESNRLARNPSPYQVVCPCFAYFKTDANTDTNIRNTRKIEHWIWGSHEDDCAGCAL
jgi:hypothetical protein